MKALTVRQPWAWAIAIGAKPIENRAWTTTHRGPLAIHAGARRDGEDALKRVFKLTGAYVVKAEVSAVIAVVDLVDVHHSVTCIRPIPDRHLHPDGPFTCSPWAIGLGVDDGVWHWQLADPRPIDPPEPHKGRLGLWNWEPTR
jgi:hypothetical protein